MRAVYVLSVEGYHCAGVYDHEGNFGYVVYGSTSKQQLKERLRRLGYVLFDHTE